MKCLSDSLYTIVEYHHLSRSSPNIWNGDDRKSDTSFCQKGLKSFSDSFIYDCWKSSFVRIFTEYLKWRWQEERHLILSRWPEVFRWQFYIRLLNSTVCQDLHRLIWNGDDRKSDTSVCRRGMKCFSNSFIYDCWIAPFVTIFIENLKWRWQEKQHLNLSRAHEVFQ